MRTNSVKPKAAAIAAELIGNVRAIPIKTETTIPIKNGAILVASNGNVYKSEVPKGKLINSVGAGDSMVAGFITGYLKNNDLNEALKMGVATGSASAFSEYLATKDKVLELIKQL